MYAFSDDEDLLVFIDCFGLSCLRADGRVETQTNYPAAYHSTLSVARDGRTAAAYIDYRATIWQLPELALLERHPDTLREDLILHPSGARSLWRYEHGFASAPFTIEGSLLPRRLDATLVGSRYGPSTRARFDIREGGETLAPLELGPERPSLSTPVRVAHDGTLLARLDDTLVCATLDDAGGGVVRWRRSLRGPKRRCIHMHADAQRCVLVVERGLRWTVIEWAQDPPGADERRVELESLAVPAIAGSFLAYQPSIDTVVRRDFDTDEEYEYRVESAGVGTIFAGPKHALWFACADHESVVDLTWGTTYPRRLPAATRRVRQAIIDTLRPHVDAARRVGVRIELFSVAIDAREQFVEIVRDVRGDDDLLVHMLALLSPGMSREHELLPGWWLRDNTGYSYPQTAVTLAQLIELDANLHVAGEHFAWTIEYWSKIFEGMADFFDDGCVCVLAQLCLGILRNDDAPDLDLDRLAERGAPSVDEALATAPADAWEGCFPATITRLLCATLDRIHGPETSARLLEAQPALALSLRDSSP